MSETLTVIEEKIKQAQDILNQLGLLERQQNKLCALTLLALAGLQPEDSWQNATRKSMTLSKGIMDFVNHHYNESYKPNSRESFRKIALKPFVDFNLVVLNPDNPSLSSSSSKTHYSLSDLTLNTLKKYCTNTWDEAVEQFIKNQYTANMASSLTLSKITIRNYKSIYQDTIELGRLNVFIGTNGCGKSNILESLAMAGAVIANEATFEGLYSRGIRSARPNLIKSSFLNSSNDKEIQIDLEVKRENATYKRLIIYPEDPNDIYTRWVQRPSGDEQNFSNELKKIVRESIASELENISAEQIESLIKRVLSRREIKSSLHQLKKTSVNITDDINSEIKDLLTEYAIYDLNTRSLRGIAPSDSRKTPLGINGEGLDLLIANFNSYEKSYLRNCEIYFDWLDKIVTDNDEKYKLEGLKPGRSTSTLYFTDKFMQKQNNILSAENSNEGILHVLFYLALFISNKTPNLFAIDNIETALNPRLCQVLIEELVELSKKRGKQVLITTHNPAVLDGLDLFDDEQRLFEVYRSDEGHTRTSRIKFKDDLSDKPHKLSEMWTLGLLGAVPVNF